GRQAPGREAEARRPGKERGPAMNGTGSEPMAARMRVLRILHASLCLGLLIFLGIVVGLGPVALPGGAAPEVPLVSYVGVGFAVICSLVALVLPRPLEAFWRRQAGGRAEDPAARERWWTLYQTRLILVAALVQGAGFMQGVAYLLEGQTFSLAVAGVLL